MNTVIYLGSIIKILDILAELMNRVPIDTAQTNWFGQKVEDLKDAYDSNMAIIKGFESIHVDEEGNFDLEDLKKFHPIGLCTNQS